MAFLCPIFICYWLLVERGVEVDWNFGYVIADIRPFVPLGLNLIHSYFVYYRQL